MKYSDYEEIIKQYEVQKKLEAYQMSRTLPRPKTTKLHVAFWVVLFVTLLTALVIGAVYLPLSPLWRIGLAVIVILLFLEFSLKFLGIKFVECYQHYASEERRRRCLCIPSCSEYAILCFKKYGFIRALVKIRKRLYRTCTGDEYKEDYPYTVKTKRR